MYQNRVLEGQIAHYLTRFPVLGITGPRQSGKSTLLKKMLPNYRYVTFDDFLMVDYFENDPKSFIKEYDHRVIFDEVQYVPQLFRLIKMAVDQNRENYGQFVLTGSSQFNLLKNISESLAGRIGLLTLLPFQLSEIPHALQEKAIYQGSYPELVTRDYQDTRIWYSAYLDTYLSKDVLMLYDIGNLRDFRRLLRMLAANTAQVFELSYYARELGVSVPTIKRWVSILEASYIIFLLPAYYRNLGKRLIKRPKLYFYDTGLVSILTGIETFQQYNKGPLAGALFENYIVSEIMKREYHYNTRNELFYLRTSDKAEIDVIVDHKTHKDFIEIKKTSTVRQPMLKTLLEFTGDDDSAYLLYNGEHFPHDKVTISPYQDYLLPAPSH